MDARLQNMLSIPLHIASRIARFNQVVRFYDYVAGTHTHTLKKKHAGTMMK